MSNEKMLETIEEFKKYVRYTGKLSPVVYQIAVEVLDIFYYWYAQNKEKK